MVNIRKMSALAGFLALLPLAYANAGQQCQLKQIASLDMLESPTGEILLAVQLSGTPQVMMLHTSSFSGMLAADVGDQLKLEHYTMTPTALVYTQKGEKFDHYMVVPSVGIGPVTANDVQFLQFDRTGAPDKRVAGTLGTDLLRNFDVELDFAKKKVNFFSPDHCPGKVVYWTRDYVSIPIKPSPDADVEIETNLDGHSMETILSTASARTGLNLAIARSAFGIDETSPGVRKNEGGDYIAGFKNLSFQGLSVPNPEIVLLRDNARERAKMDVPDRERNLPGALPILPDLTLGRDVIHQLHLYIAYQEHMLYITPADAH